MSGSMVVRTIHSELPLFADHHGVCRPAVGDTLTVGEEDRQGGSFGTVLQLVTIAGGSPAKAMLIKLFQADGSIDTKRIAANMGRLHRVLERRAKRDWLDALLAIPISVFTVEVGGETKLALLMLDLRALGYELAPLEEGPEPHRYASYMERSDGDRLDIAFRYTERAVLLEELRFLHADQNPENLMFNFAQLDAQIIDFDAGVVVEDGSERPLTPGKPDGHMPPEIKGEGRDDPHLGRYVRAAERWSVGSLVGTIIFGLHPIFFLKNISAKTLVEYAPHADRWPDVDPDGPLFGDPPGGRREYENLRESYEEFRDVMQAVPRPLIETFRELFAAGVDADRRPTALQWKETIAACRTPPIIDWVKVHPCFAVQGSEVMVEWSVRGAERVHSRQLGGLESEGRATFVVERSMKFDFTAVNRYGEKQAESPLVRVVPLPRIDFIPVPDFPGFHFNTVIPMPPYPMQVFNPFPVQPSLERIFPANLTARSVRGPQVPTLPRIPDFHNAELGPRWPSPPAWRVSGQESPK